MLRIPAIFFAFAMCCALILPQSAPAATAAVDDQGAAALKTLVEDEIRQRTELTKITGQGLAIAGPAEVTPKGAFYEVKIHGLSASFGPERKLIIGTAVMNATPAAAGQWQISISVPTSLKLSGKADTPLADISIGSQHLASTWIPSQGIYPQYNLLYRDIKISSLDADAFKAAIGSVRILSALKNNGGGSWSGPSGFEATDIKIETAGKTAAQVNIKKIAAASLYEGLDFTQALENDKKLQALLATGRLPTEEEKKALLSSAKGLFDNVSNSFAASDILIREENAAAPKQSLEIALDSVFFQADLQGARQEKSAARLKSAFSGLKMTVAADLAGLMPETMNLEVNVDNLPAKALMEILFSSLQKPQAEMNAALAALPEVLLSSGAFLSVQNSFVKSPDLYAAIDGRLDANVAAATGMTGKMTVSIKGLEAAVNKLQTLSVKPGADTQIVSYAGGLTAFMLMGQAGKTAGGEKTTDYVFEVTQDGKILLNGLNMQTLVNAGEILNSRVNHENPLIKKVAP